VLEFLRHIWRSEPRLRLRPRASAHTHAGLVLPRNEDSFLIVRLPGREDVLAAVADGLGGLEAGDLASLLAVESLLRQRLSQGVDGALSPVAARRIVAAMIQRANDELYRINASLASGPVMGTTIVAALFLRSGGVAIGHVGDSRCYRLRGERLTQLTADHTLVAELVARGRLHHSQASNHPLSHVLSQCLGSRPRVSVSTLYDHCAPGDRYLLCTDGVSSFLSEDDIRATLEQAPTPQAAADDLVGRSMAAGSVDNVTALAVFC